MGTKIWNQFYDLTTLPLLFLLVSCYLGIRYWHRLSGPLKVLAVYLWFNLGIEAGARIMGILYSQNLPLLHLYTLGECLLFSLFYRRILDENSIFKRFFPWILGITLSLVVLNTLFLQGIFEFNSYGKTLVQVLIILYALDYAFRFPALDTPDTAKNKTLQLVNAAVLIYYCGSLFIFMSSQFELQMGEAIRILWKINAILNLIFQIMILIALWKAIFKPRKSSSSPVPVS